MLSIVYGLLSAFGWGTADFVGGLSARRAGAFQTVLFSESLGMVVIALGIAWLQEPPIALRDWVWCGVAGAIGVVSLAILYQVFGRGDMSIAAPVSAVTSAALPAVVGFFSEGAPDLSTLVGFVLALAAIWLISQSGGIDGMALRFEKLKLPLVSGVGFGLYFILMHNGSQQSIFWPMLAARLAGVFSLVVIMTLQGKHLLASKRAWPILVLNTALDMGANITYILAGQSGRMDVAAVLTSLYPGMTILLAWLLLKERISRVQIGGILLALFAIVLITV